MCPQVRVWNDQSQRHLQVRWRESEERQTLEWWRGFFALVAESEFLTGKVDTGNGPYLAGLDWLVKPSNFAKVLNGYYANRKRHRPKTKDEILRDSLDEKFNEMMRGE
jgi:hypothetical protein